ncbi:hypothetical protein DPMN_076628 [Dreissena polymorpha]|uniref:Uncharacterized protein n=1 Tax=Dreissena polymorpha TaxID=45954 RepID=A0A9D3YP05_DREPO|nr:hypothetical protein DPMN_076628 [Dreissena polymorpha]
MSLGPSAKLGSERTWCLNHPERAINFSNELVVIVDDTRRQLRKHKLGLQHLLICEAVGKASRLRSSGTCSQ